MKFLTLLVLSSILSTSAFAADKMLRGELKSGKGPCSLSFERQNEIYQTVTFQTNDIELRAGNVRDEGIKTKFIELYEYKDGQYNQLINPLFLSLWPKLHKVTITNLGKGAYEMRKTVLRFNIPTSTAKDVCLTK